jgi:membrane fusion protein (multidrug efflux system)
MLLSGAKLVTTATAVLVAVASGGGAIAQPSKPSNPSGVRRPQSEGGQDGDKIVVTAAEAKDVAVIRRYACQIHAWRRTDMRALQNGSVGEFKVEEGQRVKKGDLLFEVEPFVTRDTPSRDSKSTNPKVSVAKVVAPFDGIIDRVCQSRGSSVEEGDILMTLTDTSLMWASFNVPETQYLEYIAAKAQRRVDPKIGLELGDGGKFKHPGKIGAILAEFDDKTGGIRFRADFANPGGRLRHGETGMVLMRQTHRGATVIPKRSAYEIQDKRYVYVVDEEDVVHRREIAAVNETDDIFLVKKGLSPGERILLDWDRPVFLGRKIEYEFRPLNAVIGKSAGQQN